ncbi:glycosyltransferase family 9 protein [Olivibacter sp. XZL3]|uniref:glycosyltransferase family 9 protein n=1 Tax=Olivibacter sp. XZL3 TaxID=1735116 RepID=UPI0010660381|nr:glycosyltransferase family 9 protein [Olivibacter sp. XZL3]
MNTWQGCKNILVVRADNLGDVLMSSPAFRALKESFGCRITLLTSSEGSKAASLLPMVDEMIAIDLPWVGLKQSSNIEGVNGLVSRLRLASFDACVIFTVYSQSALPAAIIAWMAGIPRRLAYCRENPYELINYWVPEKEPYEVIKHQVERDLDLVERVGAVTVNRKIAIAIEKEAFSRVKSKLHQLGMDGTRPFAVFHPGVSEEKRKFPEELWIQLAAEWRAVLDAPIVFTGSEGERPLTERLSRQLGRDAYSTGGLFSLEEFAALLKMSKLVISVNTATIHLAAAVDTPQVVLYAQTNPQHHPWMATAHIMEYSIDERVKSKNEIIRYVDRKYYADYLPLPAVSDIVKRALSLWRID